MLHGFVSAVDQPIRRGVAVGPGPAVSVPAPVAWYRGGHPVPDPGSVEAGQEALRCAADVPASGCLVVLLSGGASALLSLPAAGVGLDEKIETTRVLLGAGVPIHELNCVRKHLSGVKGGRLALAAAGRVLTLAISDVVSPVENDPGVIGSGPTVRDTTRFADALAIVDRPAIRPRVPPRVRRLLERGRDGRAAETLKASPAPDRAMYRVIGSRSDAMSGAAAAARRLGYEVTQIAEPVIGEARLAGAAHPARAAEAVTAPAGPWCVVSSGETTVTVSGGGRGGSQPGAGPGRGGGDGPFGSRGGAGQRRHRRRGRPDRRRGGAGRFPDPDPSRGSASAAAAGISGRERRVRVLRSARRSRSNRTDRYQCRRSSGGARATARPAGRVGSFAGAKLLRRRLLVRPCGHVDSFAGAKLLRRKRLAR